MPDGPEIKRERDARGRPLNARPRDGLGRPLSRDEVGVEPIPEGLALPPQQALEQAQRLLDDGQPFHAHEVLEGTWKAAPPEERELWQGLAQLAVGLTHALRGNSVGAVAVISRGRDRVAGYADAAPNGVDISGILAWSDTMVTRLEAPIALPSAKAHPSVDDYPSLQLLERAEND